MEISEIKQRLTIIEVLNHYGLKPDRNDRLHCPFHDDKTPSLQIYPKTNTYCCFSSNCNAGTGDTIQFIQLKENCTKHEALIKASSLIGGPNTNAAPAEAKLFVEPQAGLAVKIAVLTKAFKSFRSGAGLPSGA